MADVSGIADYLASSRKRRWQPGVLDCGVFMADWVVLLTGRDPIADVRGTYTSERQFLRIIRREGGFEASCAARLRAFGFREHASRAPAIFSPCWRPIAEAAVARSSAARPARSASARPARRRHVRHGWSYPAKSTPDAAGVDHQWLKPSAR
jgi:hypothetical protein